MSLSVLEKNCLHLTTFYLSQRIFLWDLDETIIIFHSLLTGSFAQKFSKVLKGRKILHTVQCSSI